VVRRLAVLVFVLVTSSAWQVRVTIASDPTPSPTGTPPPSPGSDPEAAGDFMASPLPAGRTLVLDYGASGYRYKVVSQGALPGFEAPGYDDVAGGFGTGTAAFADDTCAGPYATSWTGNTDILLRKQVNLPAGALDVQVSVAIDNDIQVFWNGADISGGLISSEGCAIPDEYTFVVPSSLLQAGDNLLAARGRERGSSQRIDLKVTAAIFTRPDCADEDLSARLDPVEPGGRVTVTYDPRFMVDPSLPNALAAADDIAHYLQNEAEAALARYDELDLPTPAAITFEVTCEIDPIEVPPWPFSIPVDAPAMTRGPGAVEIRADYVEREFSDAVRTGFDPAGIWDDPDAFWKQELIQHEVFHNVQWETGSLVVRVLGGDQTWVESPPELATDLFADADDIGGTRYLSEVSALALSDDRALDVPLFEPGTFILEGDRPYQSPSVLQYWAERFGPQDEPNLERRVARFLNALIRAPFPLGIPALGQSDGEVAAFGATLDYDYASSQYNDEDYGQLDRAYQHALDALRDYYAAHLALGAPNVQEVAEGRYVIWDAITGHGFPPGQTPAGWVDRYETLRSEEDANHDPILDLTVPGRDQVTRTLTETEGEAFLIPVPPATTDVELTISVDPVADPSAKSALRLGFIRFGDNGSVAMDPALMPVGPEPGKSASYSVGMTNYSSLGLVVVAGNRPMTYTVNATAVSGTAAVTIDAPTTADPQEASDARESLFLQVTPTIDGFTPWYLDRGSFTVRIGGVPATAANAYRWQDGYRIEANIPDALGAGTYDLTVEYAGVSSPTVTGGLVIDNALPPPQVPVFSRSYASVAQGATIEESVTVSGDSDQVAFDLDWVGSDFDLVLTGPGGRVITESSTDPDVTVEQSPDAVRITVDAPAAGDWEVAFTGTDVPTPEPVSLAVAEAGTPIHAALAVPDTLAAGDALNVRVSVVDQQGAVADATVTAGITDPSGTTWTYPLVDDGAHGDAWAGDGVYGAEVWATSQVGSYRVRATVSARDANGDPFAREVSGSVAAGPMVDGDGDGVSDTAEQTFGTDPADMGDALVDQDGDGVGLRDELEAGMDPLSVDTDGGGEHDGSELAADRDPRLASDDQATVGPIVRAFPADGRVVTLDASTATQTGSVHLWRSDGAQSTDLGLLPGSGTVFTDGPLPTGDYTYRAIGVSPSGAESIPVLVGPLHVADDITPPAFRLVVNDSVWESTSPVVGIGFDRLTETPTEMRLAGSIEALEAAPWSTFLPTTALTLPNAEGKYAVLAQIRDAAGNASPIREGFVYLVDRTPPTSAAGPLDPSYSTPTVEVPFTAEDDISGVSGVELWSRYRPVGGSWGTWILAGTSATSPITYTFGSTAGGSYEFYTIAIDQAANREEAPSSADASTEGPDLSPTWAWGSNEGGQLGAASSETCYSDPCSSVPLQVRGLPDVIEVAAGTFHSVALRVDGTVWTWGYNGYGSLGVGQGITESPTPIQVPNLSEVVSVEAEGTCSYAVKSDGTLWAWGRPWCQIVNYTSGGYTPAQVGDLTNVVAVACGQDHTLVLQGNGVLLAFGLNEYGSLGDNTTTPRTDTPVETLISDVVSIAAGDDYSIAVKADGTVWSWGLNDIGQLGLGHTRNQKRPQQVSGLASATTVAAGPAHAFAILQDGSLWAWGSNGSGQLGDGTTTYRLRPVLVANLNGLAAISAGSGHSIALTTDGSVWGWGYGAYGQLDNGSTSGQIVPTRMAASLGTFVAIAAGDSHTLAVMEPP
jgi:alpha-tubulin suppressor-like RCC1 family protein